MKLRLTVYRITIPAGFPALPNIVPGLEMPAANSFLLDPPPHHADACHSHDCFEGQLHEVNEVCNFSIATGNVVKFDDPAPTSYLGNALCQLTPVLH